MSSFANYYTLKKKILLNLIAGGMGLVNVVVISSLMKFFTDVVGMSPALYAIIFVVFSIWNGVNDPIIGYWADRKPFDSKHGKFAQLIRWGVPVMACTIIPLFFTSPSWNTIFTASYLLILLVIYEAGRTMLEVSFNAFKVNAFLSMKDRTEVQVIGSYVSMIPVLIGSMIPAMFLTGEYSRMTIVSVFSGAIIFGLIITWIGSFFVKEDPEFYANMEVTKGLKDLMRLFLKMSKNKVFLYYILAFFFIQSATGNYYTGFLYYMDNVLLVKDLEVVIPDILTGVFQMMLFPFIVIAVKKKGSKITLLLGLILAVVGHFVLTFDINYWVASAIWVLILGGYAFNGSIMLPMQGLVVDHIELTTGKRQPGVIAGIIAVFLIPASSVQTVILGALMTATGYDGAVKAQAPEVVKAIRFGTGAVPAILLLIGMFFLILLPISQKREKDIQNEIEVKHAALAVGKVISE